MEVIKLYQMRPRFSKEDFVKKNKDARNRWLLKLAGRYALVVLSVALYSLVLARAVDARASARYEAEKEAFAAELVAERAEAEAAELEQQKAGNTPYEDRLHAEAQAVAKVLYGMRNNSADDLRTCVWCIINRTDSSEYPDSIYDVIGWPGQWMGYSPDNPVIANLYEIAREELDLWHTGDIRPVGMEYVFLDWTPERVTLRDRWEEGRGCHYWRYE